MNTSERDLLARLDALRDELEQLLAVRQPPLLNKSQAAEWLGVTRHTLDKAIARWQIATVAIAESEWIAFADLQRLVRVTVDAPSAAIRPRVVSGGASDG
jgi:hypothetical protein